MMALAGQAFVRLQAGFFHANAAHFALAQLADEVENFTLITQIVDDLHERAGSRNVLNLHGSISTPRCFACNASYELTEPPSLVKEQKIAPPRCPRYNSFIRPGVVWFGESLPLHETQLAFKAAEECDVFLSIGTSGLVYPAADLPVKAAQRGAHVIHINPERMKLTYANSFQLVGTAGEIPLLLEGL